MHNFTFYNDSKSNHKIWMCREVDNTSPEPKQKPEKSKSPPQVKEKPTAIGGDVQERDAKPEQQGSHVCPLALSVPPDQQHKIVKMPELKDPSESSQVDMDLSADTSTSA